ncbi:hypothetical protein [Streptomyces sp. NPDC051546]|uniref:hypothetical protein n=1 Tax=Streptomyces sp. NPDC051546 TaxID=3365655 RepID=UPI0037A56B4E
MHRNEALVRTCLAAIPDTRMEIRTLFADDRSGACEWTMQGSTVYRFSADGRIQQESLYWDLAGVLGQFGLLPPL